MILIILIIVLFFGIILLRRGVTDISYSYSSYSVLDVLQKETIYYKNSKEEMLEELGHSKIYLNLDSNPEHLSLLNARNNMSIKELGDLNISIDNVNLKMELTSDKQGRIKTLYESVKTGIDNRYSKYLMLFHSLTFDKNGKVANIQYDSEDGKLVFDFSSVGYVDTRFLDMSVVNRNQESLHEDVVSNYLNPYWLYNSGTYEGDCNYLLFKSDALYGVAYTDLGLEVFSSFAELNEKILYLSDSDSYYKGISLKNTILDVSESRVKETPFLPIGEVVLIENSMKESKKPSCRLLVYLENGSEYYKEDINNILNSLGYSVEFIDDKLNCDILIGYTWLYNNSMPSSFDSSLNDSIIQHHNKSKDTKTVELLLHTSWVIGDADNEEKG